MQNMNANGDRRSSKRVAARQPAKVQASSGRAEITAEIRDVSTNGVFFYTDSRIAVGSEVEMVLILPPELTSGAKSWVCCHARVVRVEQGSGNTFGLAAEIQRVDVLPEIAR
ncbi:MAG: PilZ domain-containing protein [Candidatus Sulfotelmatobacter sp.]